MNEILKKDGELFVLGGTTYCLMEMMYRRYTHPSMFIAGGFILLCFVYIENRYPKLNLIIKGIIGMLLITLTELAIGVIVNIVFEWNIWDYSTQPFNFLGQICIEFSAIWFAVSIIAFKMLQLIRSFYHKNHIQNKFSV